MQGLFWRKAFGVAQSAYAGDNFLGGGEVVEHACVVEYALRHGLEHTGSMFATFTQGMPYFFSNERHKWVKHAHEALENVEGGIIGFAVDWSAKNRLNHFKIPRAEVIPYQLIGAHQGFAQAIGIEIVFNFFQNTSHSLFHPLNTQLIVASLAQFVTYLPPFHQTQCIPNFIAEVAALFADAFIERQIVAGRSRKKHAHTHTIGAIFVNQHNRIGTIAKRFGHFASQLVAYYTCKIHVFERYIVTVFFAGHNHTCHPEEYDVGSRYEVVGGIVVINFFVVGVTYAIE